MKGRMLGWMCALGLAACASPPHDPGRPAAAAAAPLAGTRWVGVVAEAVEARMRPRLEFVGTGRVTGYTGCNMLSGSWTAEGGAARLGPLVTTKRMCLGPEGAVEKRFLQALAPGARLAREGAKLVATGPDGSRFEFREASAT